MFFWANAFCDIEGNYFWERCWYVVLRFFKKYDLIKQEEAVGCFLEHRAKEIWDFEKRYVPWTDKLLGLPKPTLDELEDIVARRIKDTNDLESDFWLALALGSR